jgi:hypothetical protein
MHISPCLVINYWLTYLPTYRTYFCISEQGGEGIFFSPLDLNVFSWGSPSSQVVPQDIPIAPQIYPTQFAQSSTLMGIN